MRIPDGRAEALEYLLGVAVLAMVNFVRQRELGEFVAKTTCNLALGITVLPSFLLVVNGIGVFK